jgi:hypothetical protein
VYYWQTGIETMYGLDTHVSIGDRVLFAARYVPESDRYLLAGSSAIYVESEAGFRRLSDRVAMSLSDLRESVRQADPTSLYEAAELVLWGCLESVSTEPLSQKGGPLYHHYSVNIARSFKGSPMGESVSLRLPVSFCPHPEYRMPVPEGVSAGDSVFVFAADGPFGAYVVGGRNGLLRVDGGRLKRGYAQHEMSYKELRAFLSRGGN